MLIASRFRAGLDFVLLVSFVHEDRPSTLGGGGRRVVLAREDVRGTQPASWGGGGGGGAGRHRVLADEEDGLPSSYSSIAAPIAVDSDTPV